jgi:quercetin dioxygenase-like cupin family protein
MDETEMIVLDTHAMPWKEKYHDFLGKSNFEKPLLRDPDTGMEITLVRYPAGFTTQWHTHVCSHGMYVLAGTLVTHAGSYGPGSFVWFPEGTPMEHGAPANEEVVTLFITNKKFEINFINDK